MNALSAKPVRNTCIDFIKGIACICVVFMHCEFPGVFGVAVQAVSRFCVPFFFMVSGYFCFGADEQRAKGKIRHIFRITAGAALFYLIFAVFQYNMGAKDVFNVAPLNLGAFVFLNSPVVIVGQLWFLFALLYDYCLYYLVLKTKTVKVAYVLIPVLLVCYILLAQGAAVIGLHVPKVLYRNFLIEGFAFFMLGHFLHRNEERVRRINTPVLLTVFALSTGLCLLERFLLGRDFGVNVSSIPQVTALFIYALKRPGAHAKNPLRLLGAYCSMFVYILHPFVWHSLEYVYAATGLEAKTWAQYLMPLLVLTVTVLLSIVPAAVMNRQKIAETRSACKDQAVKTGGAV